MPSKKKKYNARFPAGRIKKIMQTDEEVGKVAQAVPVIISRTLELFVESLIKKSMEITKKKNARTLSPHHMKLCILSESRFDFLRDLVKGVPEGPASDDDLNLPDTPSASQPKPERRLSMEGQIPQQPTPPPPSEPTGQPSFPSFYMERSASDNDPSIPSPSLQQPVPESAKTNSSSVETPAAESNSGRDDVLMVHDNGNSEDEDSEDYDTS